MPPETRNCQNCKNSFTVESEDFEFYGKMGVPAPNLCPECRFRRRASFRNEQSLYNRTCELCRRSIVSMYNPASPYVVYCNDCWLSDRWDPSSYAQRYDSSRSFFEQFAELTRRVPKSATYASIALGPNINSEYTNFAGANKDCYLIFNSGPNNENCAYSRGLINSRDVFDSYYGDDVERVYEGVGVHKSSGIVWGQNVSDTLDSQFLLNCSGCQNCFGCVNLRHKSYYFFNQPLPAEEWKARVGGIAGSYQRMEEMREKFNAHALGFPRRENNNLKAVNCVGDYIFESRNCFACFEVSFAEDLKYAFSVKLAKDCYDVIGHCRKSELLLEGVGVGISQRVVGGWWVEGSHDVEYSFATRSSEYCFGCDGMKNVKFRILNQQYSEEEYRSLRTKLIEELKRDGHYGLYFPASLSPFGYNETIAQDNLPLVKEEAISQGFRWEDNLQMTIGKETIQPEQIPDHIRDVPDSITNEVLVCISCGRNYRIIPAELAFYHKMILPIPRKCFFCRHQDRIRRRGPFKLYDRTCGKCGKAVKTNFAPEKPEIVYCEQCYQAEVV